LSTEANYLVRGLSRLMSLDIVYMR